MISGARKDLAIFRRLLREARPYWPHIAGLLLLSLAAAPLQLLVPIPLKIAVDSAVGSAPLPGFLDALLPAAVTNSKIAIVILAAVLFVVVSLTQDLRSLLSWLAHTYTGERLDRDFRGTLFSQAQRQSLSRHDEKGTFDSLYRVTQDGEALKIVILERLIPLITVVFALAATIAVMLRIDWQLGLIGLSISPVILLMTETYRPRLRKTWQDILNRRSFALSVVQEALSALRVVKAFGQEEREHRRLMDRCNEMTRIHVRAAGQEGSFNLLLGLTTAVGTAIVLYVGVRHVLAGALTIGDLLVVMAYLKEIYSPLRLLGRQVGNLQSSLASAERAFAILDERPDVVDRAGARAIKRARGAVRFENVSFAYPGNEPVLRNISLEVGSGERCGIVGRSGAGKTTLISLLMRFYDPNDGRILLDGVDLRDCRLADLRKQFAIVLQEPVLFSTTIGENIAYGRPEATGDEIVAAAKAANAHDFILNLADGYATLVGERGMRLSGGERQRISLARAFLKDAPVLILDEPTSSVDMKTEQGILAALNTLMKDRTTFIIAHRDSTLTNCNSIIHLSGGRTSIKEGNERNMAEINLQNMMY